MITWREPETRRWNDTFAIENLAGGFHAARIFVVFVVAALIGWVTTALARGFP
jgi:hypothetical protein